MNQNQKLHIVAGIEFDETGDMVFERVVDLTQHMSGVRVHFCHACGRAADADDAERKLTVAEHALQRWAADRLLGHPLIAKSELHVALGHADEVLPQLAVDTEAELIVVGTHHKNRWERLTKGSVMKELVEHAPCSVVVAVARNFDAFDKSPKIDPPRPSASSADHFGRPEAFRYRRRVRAIQPQSTVGAGGQPLHPSR